jgi:hypothetical protein
LFFFPPGVAYFVYAKSAFRPGWTLAFAVMMAALWTSLIVLFYFAGRKVEDRKRVDG